MRIPKRTPPTPAFLLSSSSPRSSAPSPSPINTPSAPAPLFRFSLLSTSTSAAASSSRYSCAVSKQSVERVRMGSTNNNEDLHTWYSARSGGAVPEEKQIFCNRSLNMKSILAVGFDMDYTLAQYMPETFETLAYDLAIKKLIDQFQYPSELRDWEFDPTYMVRGLVLDKRRGNILKMDRHKYVKVAYHGSKELTKNEKVTAYGDTLTRDSFDDPDYALIDTLFSLGEAFLFSKLVDFIDNQPGRDPSNADYSKMYNDVRSAVDLCHRDGTLKQTVAEDPSKYISADPHIAPMLKMLRESGRKTFLVTNSLWDYTDVVMKFLCGYDWLKSFDVVITGSCKPSFFLNNSANLFEVEHDTGMLINTDNGKPVTQIGGIQARKPKNNIVCRVFQGGNVTHLHKLLNIEKRASQVLYIGDHIYGDILRSKKVLGWRTMLVVPELENEVMLLKKLKDRHKLLHSLRRERDGIEEKIHVLKGSVKSGYSDDCKKLAELLKLEQLKEDIRLRHHNNLRDFHQQFHRVWGQLLKTGYQNSRFAHQVERFACLYTSKVTNLFLYPPEKYYRPSDDSMPHEFDIFAE